MNRVQEVLADVLGISEVIEAKESQFALVESEKQQAIAAKEQIESEYQGRLDDTESQVQELQRAYESVFSDNRLLHRAFEDMDYLNLYDLTKIQDILPDATRPNTIKKLRQMRHENPLAKQGIRLIVRFTLGKGIRWITKNEEVRTALNDFWNDEENKILLTTTAAMKEFVDETATDGEKFFACFEAPNVAPFLKLAEVPMEEVVDIIYDPDNRRVPVYYKRKFKELIYDGVKERYEAPKGKNKDKVLYYRDYRVTDDRIEEIKDRVKIPLAKIARADEKDVKMMHAYVNPLWSRTGRRGISELFASREWFRVFREFMQDRAIINRSATAIAAKRTIKGGPAAVAQMSGKLGGVPMGANAGQLGEPGTLTRPVAGAIYDKNEAVDLDWMKTDTGAANAKEDGRMLLMVGGTGMGTSIHYFGEGGDANLATAQAMELPMVKNYEDWQIWLQSFFMEVFSYVLRLAFGDDIPFEGRVQEAIGTSPLPADPISKPDQFKLVAGNEREPAKIEIKEPEKTTVWDVVSWDFPPIISKDVVKHMTAWAQLTNQVAPGDVTVKLEAIKGALSVLGVPNVDQLMDKIIVEEEELKLQKDAQREMMMANLADPAGGPDPAGNGKDTPGGQGGVPGWTKAGSGADSQTRRLAKGKPEGTKVGRVAAGDRPGQARSG